MLTQEKLKSLVELKGGLLVWKKRGGDSWQAKRFNNQWAGEFIGSMHHTGYYVCRVAGKQYNLHRLVWLYHKGFMPDSIDHIDQNKTNNDIRNLRNVDIKTNGLNRSINSNNKSGVMGVLFDKKRGKWRCQIKHNMKQISLGYFASFFDAVCVRKSKENELGFHKNHGNKKI